MLQYVVRELRHRKLLRRLRKVNRAISAHVEIVETAKLFAVRFSRQHFHLAVLVHGQQPFDRVGYDQIAARIKNEAQRAATSISKDARLSAVGLQHRNAPILKARINSALGVECYVLRLVTVAQGKLLDRGKAGVL